MKKSNVILQAAVASAFVAMAGGVQAGTLSQAGANRFAVEVFGPTATSALAITATPVVYTFNTPGGIVVNPGGIIYTYHRIAGGTLAIDPVAGAYALGGGITGLVAAVGSVSGDKTTVQITLNNSTTDNVVIGVGGTLTWTPTAGSIKDVNTTLATVGGAVSMQASVASSAVTANTGTALPADLDNGLSNSLNIAVGAQAITGTVTASSSLAIVETQRVDLTAAAPGSRFTTPGATLSNANSATVVNLGAFKFTDSATTAMMKDGATVYSVANSQTATTLSGTVTGSFKGTSTMTIATDVTCTTAIAAGAAGTLNTALTTFTFTGGTIPATATNNYLCYTVPATTAQIPLGTPTASFTFGKATGTDAATTAAGSLYTLQYNGSQVDVRNYVPAAVTGWTTILRIINTGTVSAAISGAVIDETTGVAGTAAVLVPALASGGAATLNATEIEAALGTMADTARPRIRITAPTNGMDVQTYVFNPNGNFSIIHGSE